MLQRESLDVGVALAAAAAFIPPGVIKLMVIIHYHRYSIKSARVVKADEPTHTRPGIIT